MENLRPLFSISALISGFTLKGEVLNVFLGQCGAQMSHAFWELFCIEHGIDPEGTSISVDGYQGGDIYSGRHVFFEETKSDGFTPRTVILDTEPIVIG